jgi:hypothetical protein
MRRFLFMGPNTTVLPIWVNVNNFGAIFLSMNRTASDRTNHVDTRYRFLKGLIEAANLFEVEMNVAGIFTKNLDSKQFSELQKKLKVRPRHIK